MAILLCGCFFVGPCPVFVVLLLFLRRNANLAGGFAGRCCWVSVVLFGCDVRICHWAFWVLFTQIFTAYAIVRTEPSALSATPEEKKMKLTCFLKMELESPLYTPSFATPRYSATPKNNTKPQPKNQRPSQAVMGQLLALR